MIIIFWSIYWCNKWNKVFEEFCILSLCNNNYKYATIISKFEYFLYKNMPNVNELIWLQLSNHSQEPCFAWKVEQLQQSWLIQWQCLHWHGFVIACSISERFFQVFVSLRWIAMGTRSATRMVALFEMLIIPSMNLYW